MILAEDKHRGEHPDLERAILATVQFSWVYNKVRTESKKKMYCIFGLYGS